MKWILNTSMLIVCCLVFTDSFGQFGKLKKALDKGGSSKQVNIDWSNQKFMPAVSMSSLLANDGLRLELDGKFKINSLEISFLPKSDAKGNPIDYNPYKRSDMVLVAELYGSQSENILHTFYFTVNPVSRPFSLMTCIHRPRDDMHQETILTEGNYSLIFKVGGKEVHAFSFDVKKEINDDAYASMSELYFLDGAWRNVGRLSYNEYASEKPLFFEFYILNNTTNVENEHRPNQRAEIQYSFKVLRDGKVVAASYVNSDGKITKSAGEGRRGYWNLAGSQLTKYPAKMDRNGARNEYFTEDDLVDGTYKIQLEREHFDGTTSTDNYSFTVKSGKVVPLPEANRTSHKDWKTLIEQGPKYSFVKRTK